MRSIEPPEHAATGGPIPTPPGVIAQCVAALRERMPHAVLPRDVASFTLCRNFDFGPRGRADRVVYLDPSAAELGDAEIYTTFIVYFLADAVVAASAYRTRVGHGRLDTLPPSADEVETPPRPPR